MKQQNAMKPDYMHISPSSRGGEGGEGKNDSKHRRLSLNIYLNRNSKPLHPLTFQKKTMTN